MMKKFGIIFCGAFFGVITASAAKCVENGYTLIGTFNAGEVPAGYENYECDSCLSNDIYYWKCDGVATVAKTKEKPAADSADGQGLIWKGNSADGQKVNCMDYLRADDVDGFAKCAGLPGKWERDGNTINRVE